MINVIALVGIVKNCEVIEGRCYIDLLVENNLYDEMKEELFKVKLWRGMYRDINPKDSLRQNLIVGIKGRLETENNKTIIIAEKVTFLGKKES